jgi:hypothetical protein
MEGDRKKIEPWRAATESRWLAGGMVSWWKAIGRVGTSSVLQKERTIKREKNAPEIFRRK